VSASEKLKGLDAAATREPWHTGRVISGQDGYLWLGEEGGLLPPDATLIAQLRNALPQIVAVVEAAERAERKAMVHGGNGTLVDIARSLHPALSALEEALT
jgi:hypothetical protein